MGMYADDWAILGTLFLGIPGTIVLCVRVVPNGSGKDVWTVPFYQIDEFGKWFLFMEVQYFLDIAVLKLSLLLFYLRIFPSTTIKRLLWSTVVFVSSYGVVFGIVALTQCQPLHFFWTMWDGQHQGHCVNINAIGVSCFTRISTFLGRNTYHIHSLFHNLPQGSLSACRLSDRLWPYGFLIHPVVTGLLSTLSS